MAASDSALRKRRNPPSPSEPASTSEKLSLLIHWDELPPWRRDNAFIHTSYRRITPSYTHALRSLFYLHNESVNIWSHLLGCAIFAASSAYIYAVARPRYLAHANAADVAVFGCFFGGAMVCLGMSATYHGLVDHSEHVAKWGNKLDYTGIVALIVGSYVPALYYGFFCQPVLLQGYLYLVSSCRGRRGDEANGRVDLHSRRGLCNCFMGGTVQNPGLETVSSGHVY